MQEAGRPLAAHQCQATVCPLLPQNSQAPRDSQNSARSNEPHSQHSEASQHSCSHRPGSRRDTRGCCQNLLQRGCGWIPRLAPFHPAAGALGEESSSRNEGERREREYLLDKLAEEQEMLDTVIALVQSLQWCCTAQPEGCTTEGRIGKGGEGKAEDCITSTDLAVASPPA